MRYAAVLIAGLLAGFRPALSAETDKEKESEIVDAVRRIVEAQGDARVTIEPAESPRPAARAGEAEKPEGARQAQAKDPKDSGEKRPAVDIKRKDDAGGVSFDLQKTKASDAIDAVGRIGGITIIIDPKALAEVGDQPINLKVNDMPLGTALKWICRLSGLDFDLRDGAVFVSTPARLARSEEMHVYDVRDLTNPVEDFPGPEFGIDPNGRGAVILPARP